MSRRKCMYKKEYLLKVDNFIGEYHSNGNYVFWPNLVSSHYAVLTQCWFLKNKNIIL
jgi:hypothetical protein